MKISFSESFISALFFSLSALISTASFAEQTQSQAQTAVNSQESLLTEKTEKAVENAKDVKNEGGKRLSKEEWNSLSEEQKQAIKKARMEKRKATKEERRKKFEAASPEEKEKMKAAWKQKREERKAKWKERYEKASPEEKAKMDSWKERRKKRREEKQAEKKLNKEENKANQETKPKEQEEQGNLGHYGTPEEELARMKKNEVKPAEKGVISSQTSSGTVNSNQ